MHEFGGTLNDGQYALGGLIQGYVGDYFGTTSGGGTNDSGTIFRITSTGSLTNLYNFGALANDGLNPRTGLLQGSDSYLYGTTYEGGSNYVGTLFKIGPEGGLIYVHDFDSFIGDGIYPEGALVEGYDGNYYGTTYEGGTNYLGVVYKLTYPVPENPNQPNPNEPNPNEPNITVSGNPNGNNPDAANEVIISLASVAGEIIQLQSADSLPASVWSNVPGAAVTNSIGGPLFFTNYISGTVPQQFYRLQITP